MSLSRRQLIRNIGAVICAGATPVFLPSLVAEESVGTIYDVVGNPIGPSDRLESGQYKAIIKEVNQFEHLYQIRYYIEGTKSMAIRHEITPKHRRQ
jgi:hypothetical protein